MFTKDDLQSFQKVKMAIRDDIQETLENGVTFGFLAKEKRRYFLPLSLSDKERKLSSKSKIPMKTKTGKKPKGILKKGRLSEKNGMETGGEKD